MRKTKFWLVLSLIATSLSIFACKKDSTTTKTPIPEVSKAKASTKLLNATTVATTDYELIWSDEFNSSGGFDSTKWSYADRGTVAWNKYMTSLPAYASQDGSNLVLRMDNAVVAGDPVAYHAGGVKSMGKFSMTYGKVEVRAKFTQGRGSWPAIWMMPEPATAYGGWPGCGEIDIMEHVNNENVMYHTIHNGSVTNANGGSTASKSATYNTTDYNLYTMIWSPNDIRFYVNNVLQYTYARVSGGGTQQWPFDVPFYLILNQAGGAGWPGAITNADLPFNMQVDYVRVYKLPLFSNGDFENGVIYPWTTWGGGSSVVSTDARTGTKCIRETGGETSIEQYLTGLTPNTTYRFGGYAKVSAAGQSVSIGVKNYGGTAVDATIGTTSYSNNSVTFTTGTNNTTATVYFYKPLSGTVYGDDFYLEKL
ncbi:family 16 glycosylhydrolase [Sphingobacterium sp. UME9]|uniref:family 16 glycosylhydrolase n=1 Tax=Sphingobacterium sp. UME9 TaxID=1862316 RepID=UPI0015FFC914|nr:family 16 glycosylhydrolase [Sphingobacterium sp. UME9]MBB1645248.1 hypothetical protein [Sphingobacterium sp. UME9]